MTCPQLNMVDNFMAAGKGPEKIMEDVERVKKMALTTDAKGPLKILTTVHSAKVRNSRTLPLVALFVGSSCRCIV